MRRYPEAILFQSSRVKWFCIVLIGLMLGGAYVLLLQGTSLIGVLCGVLGLFMIAVGVYQMFRPGTLALSPDGMTQTLLGKTKSFSWNEISEFGAGRWAHYGIIPFNYVSFRHNQGAKSKHLMLGDTFGMKASVLAFLLESYRAAALGIDARDV